MLLYLFVGRSLFAILLSKSLILALGYGTDYTFHLYDIGRFHVKNIYICKHFVPGSLFFKIQLHGPIP